MNLPEEDPQVINRMLEFMYKASYNTAPMDALDSTDVFLTLATHALVYVAADYFGVTGLKRYSYDNIDHLLKQSVQVVDDVHFSAFAKYVYQNTQASHKSIRQLLRFYSTQRIDTLLKCDDFMDLLRSCNDLTLDLLLHNGCSFNGLLGKLKWFNGQYLSTLR